MCVILSLKVTENFRKIRTLVTVRIIYSFVFRYLFRISFALFLHWYQFFFSPLEHSHWENFLYVLLFTWTGICQSAARSSAFVCRCDSSPSKRATWRTKRRSCGRYWSLRCRSLDDTCRWPRERESGSFHVQSTNGQTNEARHNGYRPGCCCQIEARRRAGNGWSQKSVGLWYFFNVVSAIF